MELMKSKFSTSLKGGKLKVKHTVKRTSETKE